MNLVERANAFAHAQNPTLANWQIFWGMQIQDNSDGLGLFIAVWYTDVLGPWPEESDGFTPFELHLKP